MLDIKKIRNNVEWAKEKLGARGIKPEEIDELIQLDEDRRQLLVKNEQLKNQRNEVSEQIAVAKRNKENADDAIAAMRNVGQEIKALDEQQATIEEKQKYILLRLPNFPDDSVQIGRASCRERV